MLRFNMCKKCFVCWIISLFFFSFTWALSEAYEICVCVCVCVGTCVCVIQQNDGVKSARASPIKLKSFMQSY